MWFTDTPAPAPALAETISPMAAAITVAPTTARCLRCMAP
jgi:hypothetical protein